MTRRSPSGLSLHLEKVLRAPRARVPAAFVDEGALAAWWGRNDFTVPTVEIYTFEYEEPDLDDRETLVTLSMVNVAEGTLLVLDQRPFATEARRALHETGWAETLDGLERFLTRGKHASNGRNSNDS